MSWMEALYFKSERWLQETYRRRQGLKPGVAAATLDEMRPLLSGWAGLLSGRAWQIQETDGWPASDDERLCFPPAIEIFADRRLNRRAYLYICSFLLGQDEVSFPELMRWRLAFSANLPRENDPAFLSRLSDPSPLVRQSSIGGDVSFKDPRLLWTASRLEAALNRRDPSDAEGDRRSAPATERKKKGRDKVEVLEGLDDPQDENPLVHSFEKLHTTDDYIGGNKKKDGSDELEEQGDSLEDLDLRQVVRSTQETKAALKGDFVMDIDVAESEAATAESPDVRVFFYDEWNESKKSFHEKWCRVEERTRIVSGESSFDVTDVRRRRRREIEAVSRSFQALFKAPRWRSRQCDGTELDLDALVDLLSSPPDHRDEKMNVYLNRRRDFEELALVVLFDRSLSSDSWIDNRRVLDVTKESLVVIGEALRALPLEVQLASFASFTRNRIAYEVLKDFKDDWRSGLERMAFVEPAGYTRIGTPIRHATASLASKKARHKWLIIISDAKPTDYDRYEGRYGVRDVRRAVQEAKALNIGVRCLSIERAKRPELAEMFGPRGYELLHRPDDLPRRLGGLLKDLVLSAR